MARALKIAGILSLMSFALAADGDVNPNMVRAKLESTPYRLASGLNSFAQSVYDIVANSDSGNVVVSPFSLHTALSMVFFGSPMKSETHKELVSLLGLPQEFYDDYAFNYLKLLERYDSTKRTGKVTVNAANKVYVDDTFVAKDTFLNFIKIFYRASVDKVDFGNPGVAAGAINRFVNAKTQGKISDLLEPSDVDALTRIALINAIYFKGDWKTKFERSRTTSRPFTVNGQTFNHPETMVTNSFFRMGTVPELDASILELPYTDEDYRMLVFLPNSDQPNAVRDLDSKLRTYNVDLVDPNLDYGRVIVEMPKFKASGKAQLSEVFRQLGVRTLFDSDLADLSDISDEPDLFVQKIIHQAELEVNEEGSEAAAATAVLIGTRTASVGKRPRSFKVNRPFVFVIQDRSLGVPLFMGRIVDPSGQRRLGAARATKQMSAALMTKVLRREESEDNGSESIRFPDERGRR